MQTQKRRAQSVPSLLSLLFIIFFTEQLVAQQTKPLINSTLQGQVLDSITKEPLPGALVHIEGTTHSVSTDEEGKFGFVTGQIFPYTLEISYIGYEKKKIIA